MKVLDSSGQGGDVEILAGLTFVLNWVRDNPGPAVVSMSLGGVCESYDACVNDLLVGAVEELTKAGICLLFIFIVSVELRWS